MRRGAAAAGRPPTSDSIPRRWMPSAATIRASHARAQALLAGRGSEAEIGAVAVNAAAVLYLFDRPNLPQNAAEVRTRLGEGRLADLVRRMAGEPRE